MKKVLCKKSEPTVECIMVHEVLMEQTAWNQNHKRQGHYTGMRHAVYWYHVWLTVLGPCLCCKARQGCHQRHQRHQRHQTLLWMSVFSPCQVQNYLPVCCKVVGKWLRGCGTTWTTTKREGTYCPNNCTTRRGADGVQRLLLHATLATAISGVLLSSTRRTVCWATCNTSDVHTYILPILQMWDTFIFQWPKRYFLRVSLRKQ